MVTGWYLILEVESTVQKALHNQGKVPAVGQPQAKHLHSLDMLQCLS